jgi:hypothetical protein
VIPQPVFGFKRHEVLFVYNLIWSVCNCCDLTCDRMMKNIVSSDIQIILLHSLHWQETKPKVFSILLVFVEYVVDMQRAIEWQS